MIFGSKRQEVAKLGVAKDHGKKFRSRLASSFRGIVHFWQKTIKNAKLQKINSSILGDMTS